MNQPENNKDIRDFHTLRSIIFPKRTTSSKLERNQQRNRRI